MSPNVCDGCLQRQCSDEGLNFPIQLWLWFVEKVHRLHATDAKAKDTGKDEVVYGVGIELCHMF